MNPGTLFGATFTLSNSTFSSATTLATAGTNFAFRGLEVAPVPEPHEYARAFSLLLIGLVIARRYRVARSA